MTLADRIAALKAANAARTPGTWTTVYEGYNAGDKMVREIDDDPALEPDREDVLFGDRSAENWLWILRCTEHVPAVIAACERMRVALMEIDRRAMWADDPFVLATIAREALKEQP